MKVRLAFTLIELLVVIAIIAIFAGPVSISHLAWVGIGATIIDHITIGHEVIVGAGAVVQ